MALCISYSVYATSKQGKRMRFGMLNVLTNIRSTKVLHHASCIKHNASCIAVRRLRFGMSTDLTNVISTKLL